jgi:hypothetical protein
MEPPPAKPPISLPSPPTPVDKEGHHPTLDEIPDEIDIQVQQREQRKRLQQLQDNLQLQQYNPKQAKIDLDIGIAKQKAWENREWWSIKDTLRSMGNGANNFGRQLFEFGGGSAKKAGWKQDSVGESDTVLGPFISGMTQFIIPFGGLTKANRLRKARRDAGLLKSGQATREKWKMGVGGSVKKWTGVFMEGAALGGVADFLAFDPREPNAFNAAIEIARKNNWDSRMPGFTNILEEWLAHANAGDFERDINLYDQLAGRLKNVSEGIIVGGAFNVMLAGFSRNTMWLSMANQNRKLTNLRSSIDELAGTKPQGAQASKLTSLTKEAEAMELGLIKVQNKFLGAHFSTGFEDATGLARLRKQAEVEMDNWKAVRRGEDIPEGAVFEPYPMKVEVPAAKELLEKTAEATSRKKWLAATRKKVKDLKKAENPDKALIAELEDKLASRAESGKTLAADIKRLKQAPPTEVPDSLLKFGGPVREAEFHKLDNAQDRGMLVTANGKSILMDSQTVYDDFVNNNMAYLTGNFKDKVTGRVSVRSQQEKTVLEAMNLDPAKLQAHFINLGDGTKEGGAAVYAKFLELRQRHILKQLKQSKATITDLNPNNINHLKTLTSATYDALTLSNAKGGLNFDPRTLADVTGRDLMRTALPVDYEATLKQVLRKGPKGEPIGMVKIDEAFQRARKGEITQEEFQSALRANINLNELGTDSRAALVALTNLFETSFSRGAKTIEARSETLARSLGWAPEGNIGQAGFAKLPDPRTAQKFLADTYENDLNGIADSLGVEADYLDSILKSGDGPYSKALKVIPEDVKLGELSHGDIQSLHHRILAMRLRSTARMETAQKMSAALIEKYNKGTDVKTGQHTAWEGDLRAQRMEEIELARTIYKMRLDLESLQTARSAWGRQGQAFQNLDKYLNMTDASGKSLYSDKETLQVMDDFIEGLGGEGKIADLAEIIDVASRTPVHGALDEMGRSIDVAKLVDKASGAHFLEMVNELWINAMLSGLRTHAVNNVSNAIKVSVSLGQRVLGSVIPDSLVPTSLTLLKGKGGGKAPNEVLNLNAKEGEGAYITIDAGTKAAFQRSAAVRQFTYSFSVMRDIFRMLRNTDDKGVLIHGPKDAKGMEALSRDRQLQAKGTVENFSEGELNPRQAYEESKFTEMGGTAPMSSASIKASLQRGANAVLGPSASEAVGKLADTSVMGGVGVMWDGFYNSVVRMPIRKMVAADQAWKAAHIGGNVVGTLSSYAQTILKMEDPDLIAEWVMAHKDGIVRPNGELFSKKSLEMEFNAAADKLDMPLNERSAAKDQYMSDNYDLRDGDGNLLMAGEVREKLAEQARRDSLDFTYQRDLDQSRIDLAEMPASFRNETEEFIAKQSIGSWLSDGARNNPWMKQFFPFVRTAMNIFQDAGDNFPILNLFRNRHKADMFGDPNLQAAAKGRMVTSTAMLSFGYAMASQGFITGRGPSDAKERAVWLKTNRPYAINLGNGEFISYKRIEPYGLIFRWTADFYETQRFLRTPAESQHWAQAGASAIYTATIAVTQDVTYAQNVGELMGLMEDSLGKGKDDGRIARWWRSKKASHVPNLVEGFGGSIDDFERELKRKHSAILAKAYPFGIPHKRDKLFGYVEEKHHYYWNRYVHALTPAKAWKLPESSQVYKVMASHFGSLSAPSHLLKEKLDMTKFYAIVPLSNKPSGTSKEAKKKDALNLQIWDTARKMKTMKVSLLKPDGSRSDYRTQQVPCPVFPGQDAYDYKQQYISVRKEYYNQKDFQTWAVAADLEFGGTKAGENAKAWLADVETAFSAKKALTLEETLLLFINSKRFRNWPDTTEQQKILKEKDFRLKLMQGIIQKWRDRAQQELLGESADAFPKEKWDSTKGDEQYDDLYYNGPLGIFWPNLAWSAARLDTYNHTLEHKKLEDRPLIQERIQNQLENKR